MNQDKFPKAYYDIEADKRGELQHHLKLQKTDIGRYILMPGDPKRCKEIAKYLDDARFVADFREYVTYTGTLNGERVSVVSHGIGSPSTAIALEELIKLGADTFIRIGTSGGMQEYVIPGGVVIVDGATKGVNTVSAYIPSDVPTVPDFDVLEALVDGAKNTEIPYYVGAVHCKDAFYAQHAPSTMAVSEELFKKWDSYIRSGALVSEMESSALFAVATSKGVRAGAAMLVVWNQERRKKNLIEEIHDTSSVIQLVIEGLKILIERDRQKEFLIKTKEF